MPARRASRILAVFCSFHVCLAAAKQPQSLSSVETPVVKAWGAVFQVVEALAEHVGRHELGLIHNEDMRLYQASAVLRGKEQLERAEKKDELELGWLMFARKVAELHAAADAFNQQESEARLKTVLASFEEMKRFYDPETLSAGRSLAERYTCPMHPDVTGRKDDPCPKCGMALDLPRMISMFPTGTFVAAPHTIRAQVGIEGPLTIGMPVAARLWLTGMDGSPIPPEALREVHTRKIHLLIIDSSLTDYHHEHPVATATPGEYRFSFVPRKPGSYRAWADLQPYATGFQEFAMADIFGAGAGEAVDKRDLALAGRLEGLTYTLRFDRRKLHAGQPVRGTLRVLSAERRPYRELEPLMGAFAHLVGFHEDRETVLHMHPIGSKLLTAEDRGGPDLEFQLYTTKPGFYRLFAQVQIGGVSKFVPFALSVLP